MVASSGWSVPISGVYSKFGVKSSIALLVSYVIADAAARLFTERGYEQVAVSDVAREAEVSEQRDHLPANKYLQINRF
jgi:hypothetical protein